MSELTPPQMTQRQCTECGKVKKLDPKNYARLPGTQDAYKLICRKCQKEQARKAKLSKIENAAVDAFVQQTIKGGANIPHTAELLESLMHYFGGVNGFASIAMKQYWDSTPGSRTRSSILEMIVRLAAKNTEQGGAKKPIQLYSEEELESEIDARLKQAVITYSGGYINVQAEEEVPAAALPSPDSPQHFELPAGGIEELARRAYRQADGVLAALQADSKAVGVPPVPVQ
jgi:hypothetical protein